MWIPNKLENNKHKKVLHATDARELRKIKENNGSGIHGVPIKYSIAT